MGCCLSGVLLGMCMDVVEIIGQVLLHFIDPSTVSASNMTIIRHKGKQLSRDTFRRRNGSVQTGRGGCLKQALGLSNAVMRPP